MMGSVPKRLIRWPVKKPGANMPITCHSSTSAASENGRPQTCMAIGVAAIRRFITPKPSAPAAAATMNTGWRMISPRGLPPLAACWGGVGGKWMNASKAMASRATPASAR